MRIQHSLLLIAGLAIALIAYGAARSSRCELCFKPFAVFSILGRLRIRQRVCRECRRRHLALRRNFAR